MFADKSDGFMRQSSKLLPPEERLIDTKDRSMMLQKKQINDDFPKNAEANKYMGYIHKKMAEHYHFRAEKSPTAVRAIKELSGNNKRNVLTVGRAEVQERYGLQLGGCPLTFCGNMSTITYRDGTLRRRDLLTREKTVRVPLIETPDCKVSCLFVSND